MVCPFVVQVNRQASLLAIHSVVNRASSKMLSTEKNTSNLLKHLLQHHSNNVEKNPTADREASTASDTCTPAKQQKLDFRAGHSGGEMLSGQDLKKLITGYIVQEMLLVSTVD